MSKAFDEIREALEEAIAHTVGVLAGNSDFRLARRTNVRAFVGQCCPSHDAMICLGHATLTMVSHQITRPRFPSHACGCRR
jgi:hypothetical protein